MKTRVVTSIIVLLSFYFVSSNSFAQDTIVKANGDSIIANVIEITPEVIKYYKYTRPEGPLYTLFTKDLLVIKYPDGSNDTFEYNTYEYVEKDKGYFDEKIVMRDKFIDVRDSMEYNIVKIEDDWWMAENLKFTTEKSRCYKNIESHCGECGQLYNYWEATKACPEGWHLSTDEEWKKVEMWAGMQYTEVVKSGWRGTPPGQSNYFLVDGDTGLEIKYCGYNERNYDKYYSVESFLWTSDARNKNCAWIRNFKRRASIGRECLPKDYKLSVRCVKNIE